jgi:DNA invertase Pin-like site-specific DNA recombinase
MAESRPPRRRLDLGPAAVAHLRNERQLRWAEIARLLHASARTVRRVYATAGQSPEQDRRGRPYADVDPAEVVRLRDSGMSWRAIARKLNRGVSTVLRTYARTRSTSEAPKIKPTCTKNRQK